MTTADQDLRAKLIDAIAFETGWEEGAENIADIVLSIIGPRLDQITRQAEMLERCREAIESIAALTPFAIVQGDEARRFQPESRINLNSNVAWVVSNSERAAHRLRKHINVLNAASETLATLSDMGGAAPELADARADASEARGSAARATEETPPATVRP